MTKNLSSPNPFEGLEPEVQQQAGWIIYKAKQLGFGASLAKVEEGPILRSFFFTPALDSLFSKILNKDQEIAGILAVESARLYRHEGLLVCEVPKPNREIVRFDKCINEMMLSPLTRSMQLPLLMGVNPKGEYLYVDLAAQPHCLIAGSTGSGKSVFTSQILCSMALLRPPSELEIIIVDTKNLDLVLFKGLAHIRETITDVDVLRGELEALLSEVRHRTRLMSGVARNIHEYNEGNYGRKLAYRVLIIDELADVLETDAALRSALDKKERADNPSIVSLLKMITQISRASGIHIIAATQRPSTKMVTGDQKIGFGDIKANFPCRICFKLPSMGDSRVVLDENGAEELLGKGDYLYKAAGLDTPQRAHSAYVSMADIATILAQHEDIRRMYAAVLAAQPPVENTVTP